ncbi:MAG: hypothetical protein HXY34_08490 [Candidatus Thorarchaeota archaeon]|nr:hypothetical protein [Candidatus Thorarchaeota archaeon]
MPSLEDVLNAAKAKLARGDRADAAKLIMTAAKAVGSRGMNLRAARLYEDAADVYREGRMAQECYDALENATLMLIRQGANNSQSEIARVSEKAGDIAREFSDYKRAADFYSRAGDYASEDDRRRLSARTAEVLLNMADASEEKDNYEEALAVLKRIGRLYFAGGEVELGRRINSRAERVANKWAEKAKKNGDYLSAGNALAEAAQLKQNEGDFNGAARLMLMAGELYETAGLFEKAGNIYDAAQEVLKAQRLTSASRSAMAKASEAYLKMEGKPEVVAPLLVRAGNMFTEIGLGVKAKWAFKRAADIFAELAEKSIAEGDPESEKKYLRFRAMCLKRWGAEDEAADIYRAVTDYYLGQASNPGAQDNMEAQALALEEAAAVLHESDNKQEGNAHLERALQIYVELADKSQVAGQADECSKFYTKAAEVAMKLGDLKRSASFHWMACQKAEGAAEYYSQTGVPELATIWLRTAGNEALATQTENMVRKGIELLRQSAKGFRQINEMRDAFEDLYVVLETLLERYPENTANIREVLAEMEEIAITTKDEYMTSMLTVLKAIEKKSYVASVLMLQEHEDALQQKRDRLGRLIESIRTPQSVQT